MCEQRVWCALCGESGVHCAVWCVGCGCLVCGVHCAVCPWAMCAVAVCVGCECPCFLCLPGCNPSAAHPFLHTLLLSFPSSLPHKVLVLEVHLSVRARAYTHSHTYSSSSAFSFICLLSLFSLKGSEKLWFSERKTETDKHRDREGTTTDGGEGPGDRAPCIGLCASVCHPPLPRSPQPSSPWGLPT